MIIKEVQAKSILNKSKIYDLCLNPYTGCGHGCRFCYARLFIPRYSGHKEPWGSFVDAKVNAPEVLEKQLRRMKKRQVVWVSSVCDPYQPAERKYRLTRRCLQVLAEHRVPVSIQTRSSLVLRDVDVLKGFEDVEVGMSISTEDEGVLRLFEPGAPPAAERFRALGELRRAGISTFAFLGPLLPGDPEALVRQLEGNVHRVLVDRMNYTGSIRGFYRGHGLGNAVKDDFFSRQKQLLRNELEARNIAFEFLF